MALVQSLPRAAVSYDGVILKQILPAREAGYTTLIEDRMDAYYLVIIVD